MSTHRRHAPSRLARTALLVAASLACAPVAAVVVERLNQVEVPVADQSPAARDKAFRAALALMVVRLTGDPRAPAAAELAPLMRTPQRFIAEFAYVTPPVEAGVPTMVAAGTVPAQLRLFVRFEGPALQQALRETGRKVLGRERPQTLLWLVLDEGGERDLVGAEDGDAFIAAAAQRALPLAFPPLDGEDRAALGAADVVAQDEAKLAAASARHAPQAWVSALVWRAPGAWQGRFTLGLALDGTAERFDAKGATLDALAAQAMDRVAATLASRYAVAGTELLAIDVAIEAVASVDGYAGVSDLLEGMSIVRRVEVIGVNKDLLELRVTFVGDPAALERTIGLDPRLARSVEAAREGALRYRYAP